MTTYFFTFAFSANSLKVLLKVTRGTFVAGLAGILISWPFSGFLPIRAALAGRTLMNIFPILPMATRSPLMAPVATSSKMSSRTCLASFRASPFFSARYPTREAPVSLSGTFGDAFLTAGVFATTTSYTRRIVQPTAATVAFALFAIRDKATEYTEKWIMSIYAARKALPDAKSSSGNCAGILACCFPRIKEHLPPSSTPLPYGSSEGLQANNPRQPYDLFRREVYGRPRADQSYAHHARDWAFSPAPWRSGAFETLI